VYTKIIAYFFSEVTFGINQTAKAYTFSYTVYFLCITVLSSNVLDGTVKQILRK